MTAIEPAREGLKMDCLYSQFVNEWAIPLSKGPEAITRLSAWIHGDKHKTSGIPFSPRGVWVHCPIEVRVSTTAAANNRNGGLRGFLDPLEKEEPTLYLNATLYRPYGKDPPCWKRYYRAFEWLMREMGGRPHWAKNFAWTTKEEVKGVYGEDMEGWLRVRREVDPEGLWLGEWHARNLCLDDDDNEVMEKLGGEDGGASRAAAVQVERVTKTSRMGWGWGDAVLWEGKVEEEEAEDGGRVGEPRVEGLVQGRSAAGAGSGEGTPSPPVTSASQESFDYMAKGEASVYVDRDDDDDGDEE